MKQDHKGSLPWHYRGKTIGFTLQAFEKTQPLEVDLRPLACFLRWSHPEMLCQELIEVRGRDGYPVFQRKKCISHARSHNRLLSQIGPSQKVVHNRFVTIGTPHPR